MCKKGEDINVKKSLHMVQSVGQKCTNVKQQVDYIADICRLKKQIRQIVYNPFQNSLRLEQRQQILRIFVKRSEQNL